MSRLCENATPGQGAFAHDRTFAKMVLPSPARWKKIVLALALLEAEIAVAVALWAPVRPSLKGGG